MAPKRKDYKFVKGDRIVFRLFGGAAVTSLHGVVTDVAPRGPVAENWDYKVLLDRESARPRVSDANPTGEALVLESELTPEET